MTRRVTGSFGLAVVVVAVSAGCVGEGPTSREGDRPQVPGAQEQSPDARPAIPKASPKSALRALETATGHIDDGTAFSLDWNKADDAWQIEVVGEESTAHKITVAAGGDEKLDAGSVDVADHADMANAVDAQTDAAKVVRTATGDHSGGVAGLEIGELGDGTPVWRITLDDSGERTRYVFSTDTGDEISSQRDAS